MAFCSPQEMRQNHKLFNESREPAPRQCGAFGQSPELSEGSIPREILHAAVRRGHETFRGDERQGLFNAAGHDVGCFDLFATEIEHAEQHRLAAKLFQNA
jgi:hypothetical protein